MLRPAHGQGAAPSAVEGPSAAQGLAGMGTSPVHTTCVKTHQNHFKQPLNASKTRTCHMHSFAHACMQVHMGGVAEERGALRRGPEA